MNEFFASVKADLTDRRMLPAVAVVCALLVAALAYALLGGGGSSNPAGGPVSPASPLPSGIAVTGAQARKAVAETTDGFHEQKGGSARDPFSPVAGVKLTVTAPNTASGSAPPTGSGSSEASGSSASGGGGESPSSETTSSGGTGSGGESKPKSKSKSKTVYDVNVLFGTLPPGIAPDAAQLHEYAKLKLQTPLPSSQQPLLVFRGVTAKGRAATFTLVGEAILTGAGTCLPSPTQCEAVDLKPGETEQLNYLGPNGESTIYELRVKSISAQKAKQSSAKASAASRHADGGEWGVSRVGQELLRKAGLVALPFLRYSSQPGVLIFAKPKAKKADAHGAKAARSG